MTERLYYTDCYLREFSAQIVECSGNGSIVYLDRTAFYPTSGGQPFDTGTHELHIRRSLRIGQKAPSLETQSLDGKAIKLQDFKGKYVLLDFCAKWAGMNASQVTSLKSLYDSYGKDGRLVIISLSVDYDEKQAREMVTDSKVPWPVCYLGPMGQTQVPAMFGVEGIPHAILISPEGMVVNKNMQGTYMKNTVKKAVDSKTVTAKNTP